MEHKECFWVRCVFETFTRSLLDAPWFRRAIWVKKRILIVVLILNRNRYISKCQSLKKFSVDKTARKSMILSQGENFRDYCAR